MPNWCDCTLTITGPSIENVLSLIRGDKAHKEGNDEYVVYLDPAKIVPVPQGVEDTAGWRYDNWGCRYVCLDRQYLTTHADRAVISFCTPWNPPLYAIQKLSAMFPENTFLLEDIDQARSARGAAAFRAAKGSNYYRDKNYNSNTRMTATLHDIFCAVLERTNNDLDAALTEVSRVKAIWTSPELDIVREPPDPDLDESLNKYALAVVKNNAYSLAEDEKKVAALAEHIRQTGARGATNSH